MMDNPVYRYPLDYPVITKWCDAYKKFEKVRYTRLYEVLYGEVNIFMPVGLGKRRGYSRYAPDPKK